MLVEAIKEGITIYKDLISAANRLGGSSGPTPGASSREWFYAYVTAFGMELSPAHDARFQRVILNGVNGH
jgi:hypothetical protein